MTITGNDGVNVQFSDGTQARKAVLYGGDNNPIGQGRKVRVEKTRPNDANAYAANDALNESASAGTNWTFAVGTNGLLVGALLACDNVANTARFELDLYDAAVTAINDNAEATHLYANEASYLGTLTFAPLAKRTVSSTKVEAALTQLALPLGNVSGSVAGILRTLDVFTPTALSKYSLTLLVA